MTKSLNIGNHCVPAIKKRLELLSPLPSRGIIAGQAVASALMEVLALGTGVYNDIDIFMLADSAREAELASSPHRESEALRLGLPVAALDDYRAMQMGADHDLQILGATEDGLINYVWCKAENASLNGPRILYGFDLNAVEVALDLETDELSWSRAFEYFAQTKELQVTSLGTPARTLLRYFKKREELQAYGKDQLVVDMLASWVEYCSTQRAEVCKLSSKYQRLAKTHLSQIAPAFDFDEASHSLKLSEAWMYPEGMEDVLAEALGESGEAEGIIRLVPRMLYGQALKRPAAAEKQLEEASAVSDGAEDDVVDLVQMSLSLLGYDYLADHRTKKHIELVKATLAKHEGLCSALFGLSLNEQYECLLDLRKRAKKDGEHVYGTVEASALPSDMWNQSHRDAFFVRVDREETHLTLAEPFFSSFEQGDATIKELLTTRSLRVEGSELSHCVGGYSETVRSGRSRILSLRCGNEAARWSTAEVGLSKDKKTMNVRQHYARGNKPPHPDNKALLQEFLTTECARLGYSLSEKNGIFGDLFW